MSKYVFVTLKKELIKIDLHTGNDIRLLFSPLYYVASILFLFLQTFEFFFNGFCKSIKCHRIDVQKINPAQNHKLTVIQVYHLGDS